MPTSNIPSRAGRWPAVAAACMLAVAPIALDSAGSSMRLSLPVVSIERRIPPYADLCEHHPGACRLERPSTIPAGDALMSVLQRINSAVNRDTVFALDRDIHGVEDYRSWPENGFGDCEDIALEKRTRLVGLGYAPAALRLALVLHRQHMSSHCVLTVETSTGTFLMDSQYHRVMRRDSSPYNFEARERSDGLWDSRVGCAGHTEHRTDHRYC